jgi:nitroreductase
MPRTTRSAEANEGMSVSDAVASRRSVRAFLDRPVPQETIRSILDKARMTPSGCNIQPWQAIVLAGEPLKALQKKVHGIPFQEPPEYDQTSIASMAPYAERLHGISAELYGSMGIARENADARARFANRNWDNFGAPAVLFCYFPRMMKEPNWSDVGMWLQTIMLLAREAGLDTCPQESLAFHARIVKDHLGIDDEKYLFFCGLAIGYRDPAAPENNFTRPRLPLNEQIAFRGF